MFTIVPDDDSILSIKLTSYTCISNHKNIVLGLGGSRHSLPVTAGRQAAAKNHKQEKGALRKIGV
jgi:hypothetical protein